MQIPRWARLASAVLAVSLVAAACGGDDSEGSSATTAAEGDGSATTAAGGAGGEDSPTNLAGVCPSRIVVQTDWHAEAEHGGLYQMLGDDYDVDTNNYKSIGPLMAGDVDTGVEIEIREGGPAIGFEQVSATMYKDESIHLGYVSTSEAVQQAEQLPTVGVMAPFEKNPQILMWDPATYPDVNTIADLGAKNILVRYFADATYIAYFVATGVLQESQLDSSYDGTPAVFVSEGGKIAQQGFASAEPYIYMNEVEAWHKPVKFQLVHDAGFQSYSQTMAVRAGDLEELTPCLEKFVPIMQQAQVDYLGDPARSIEVILDLTESFDDGWQYSQGVAEFSVEQQEELGIVDNGPDATLGNFDEARVQEVINLLAPLEGFAVAKNVKPADVMTNEFIDESIGL
ncbi:MAG: ABC transporter substrate-binding protein [Acidimicrobiia bacterium]|nr:ABC transporter substrate-binding protein [Acidimicrobiia bacterium]